MFEYQTAICELTGLPVSNASVYEGPSAVAAAAYLAKLHNGARRIVASAGLHPHSLQTLRTNAHGFGMEVIEVPLRDGVTDPDAWVAAINDDTSAAIFAQPNFYGAVEDAEALSAAAKASISGPSPSGNGRSDGARRWAAPARSSSRRSTQSRSGSSGLRANVASTSQSARVSRSATAWTSAARPSDCSLPARSICGACPGASPARPSTWTAGVGSC